MIIQELGRLKSDLYKSTGKKYSHVILTSKQRANLSEELRDRGHLSSVDSVKVIFGMIVVEVENSASLVLNICNME